jgi:hypothetical protein
VKAVEKGFLLPRGRKEATFHPCGQFYNSSSVQNVLLEKIPGARYCLRLVDRKRKKTKDHKPCSQWSSQSGEGGT